MLLLYRMGRCYCCVERENVMYRVGEFYCCRVGECYICIEWENVTAEYQRNASSAV